MRPVAFAASPTALRESRGLATTHRRPPIVSDAPPRVRECGLQSCASLSVRPSSQSHARYHGDSSQCRGVCPAQACVLSTLRGVLERAMTCNTLVGTIRDVSAALCHARPVASEPDVLIRWFGNL